MSAPAPITSARSGCMNGRARRCATVIATTRSISRVTSAVDKRARLTRSRSYCGRSSTIAPIVMMLPATPMIDPTDSSGSVDGVQCRSHVGNRGSDLARRRRVAVQVPFGDPDGPHVERHPAGCRRHAHCPAPAQSILLRCRAPATAARMSGPTGELTRGTVVRQPSLLVTGDDLRLDAQPVPDAVDEDRPVPDVSRGRRGDEADASTRARSMTPTYSSSVAKVRSRAASANTPVRSTSCPSRTIVVRRSSARDLTRLDVEVGHQQAQGVGAAVKGGDSSHPTRSPSLPESDARSARPPLAEQLEGLVADRVHPWTGCQRMRGQRVQALDPGGHPAGRRAGDLGDLAVARAVGQVRRVRPPGNAPGGRGHRRAGRPAGSSAHWPRACRSPPPRAGRSGSRRSGTVNRHRVGATSRRRRGCRTDIGARHPPGHEAGGRAEPGSPRRRAR